MDTSINITQYRKRIPDRRWRRGIRRLLAWGLLICLLSACAGPMPTQAAEVDTPQEMVEGVEDQMDLPDNNVLQDDIIPQILDNAVSIADESELTGDVAPVEPVVEDVAEDIAGAEEPSEDRSAAPAALDTDVVELLNTVEISDCAPVEDEVVLMSNDVAAIATDTTWQNDYDYELNSSKGTIRLKSYKRKDDRSAPTEITVPATATVNGTTYGTRIDQYIYRDCYYIRKITFEDGVALYTDRMNGMFRECFSLEEIDFGTLDTTGVVDMSTLFMNCIHLKRLDLSGFNTRMVLWMSEMFQNCYRLEDLNVSGWETPNCIDMWLLFADCMSLKRLDLSSWSTPRCQEKSYAMDSMFSVALEELTLGPGFHIYSSSSGLLGTWTDGTETYTAAELEQQCKNGTPAGTYRRISLGGGRASAPVREQETLTLPEGYKRTVDLTESDMVSMVQQNGQMSDAEDTDDGQMVKTAEWTDQDAGEAQIDLAYAVPSQGGSRAVFSFGTCTAHGFGADLAITQMLELLDQYDYVDAMTTSSQYWQYYYKDKNFLGTSREVTFTLSAADGREANYNQLMSMFIPEYLDADGGMTNYNIINFGSHASGVMLLQYLADYLKENTPTAIYVSFDGSRAFCNDTNRYHRASAVWPLYGTPSAYYGSEISNKDYDDLIIDDAAMNTLAEYQRDGRYYVCICDPAKYKSERYDYASYYHGYDARESREARLLCYASFALMTPYEFVHNNAEIRDYVDNDGSSRTYESFRTVGRAAIKYGVSFTSQDVQYITAPLTITDTVDSDLMIDAENILVTVTLGGEALEQQPDIDVTVDGQNIRIYLSEVTIGEVVNVHIPVHVHGAGYFRTADNRFRNTNAGPAVATTAAGNTVTVDSPQLYKGTYLVITEVENGTITDSVMDLVKGDDCEITYSPQEGYHLESITVDGESVDIKEYESSYGFTNIDANHVIRVVYVPDEEPEDPADPDDKPIDPVDPDDKPADPVDPDDTPTDPEEPDETPDVPTEEPDDDPEPTPSERRHRSGHSTPETPQVITTTSEVITAPIETIMVPDETPMVLEETGAVSEDTAEIATGDDSQMLVWLSIAGITTIVLLGWIAFEVHTLEQ